MGKDERKNSMVQRAQEHIIKQGLQGLKVDDLAKIMGVSRAKLYQYFGSKDGVIEAVVTKYIHYLDQLTIPSSCHSTDQFIAKFPDFFFENMAYLGTMTELFICDLQQEYPELYNQLKTIIEKREAQISDFYAAGIKAKAFRPELNGKLLILQNKLMIPMMLSKDFLFLQQLTLEEVIQDYYQQLISEIFLPEYQEKVRGLLDTKRTMHLVEKYTRIFNF